MHLVVSHIVTVGAQSGRSGGEGNDAMSNVAAQSPKCCKEIGQRKHESRNGVDSIWKQKLASLFFPPPNLLDLPNSGKK